MWVWEKSEISTETAGGNVRADERSSVCEEEEMNASEIKKKVAVRTPFRIATLGSGLDKRITK